MHRVRNTRGRRVIGHHYDAGAHIITAEGFLRSEREKHEMGGGETAAGAAVSCGFVGEGKKKEQNIRCRGSAAVLR
ncbi:MAG: hypothetical protein LBJ20_03495, partial [Candidatus Methanoplasma sp.]|nr:hypothetical protein [Candidatus Methanoplasma sp.]